MKFLIVILILFSAVLYLSDFKNVNYDSEPDYIANGLIIHKNYFPSGSHHPGTVNYYLVSSNLLITKYFNLDIKHTIAYLRIFYFLFFLLIVYWTKTNSIIYFIYLTISELSILGTFNFIISAEIFLVPLSFLIFYLIKSKQKLIYISIVFGLMLNTKFSSLLVIPLLVPLLKYSKPQLLKFFILSFLFYILFSLPAYDSFYSIILPVFNTISQSGIINLFESLFLTDIILSNNSLILLAFSLIAIVTAIIFLINYYYDLLITPKFLAVTIGVYIILIIILFENPLLRHFAPTLPLILLNINLDIIKNRYFRFAVYSFFTLIIIKKSLVLNINFNSKNKIDSYISDSVKKVYLFQSSKFNSETEFLQWTKYCYGNSLTILPEKWKTNNYYKTEYLNTRDYFYNKKAAYSKLGINYNKNLLNQLNEMKLNNSFILINSEANGEFIISFDQAKINLKHNFQLIKYKETKNYLLYKII